MTIDVETVSPLRLGAAGGAKAQFVYSAPYHAGTVEAPVGALGRGTYHSMFTINNPTDRVVPVILTIIPAAQVGAASAKQQRKGGRRGVTAKQEFMLRPGVTVAFTIGGGAGAGISQRKVSVRQETLETGTVAVYAPVRAEAPALAYLKVTATYTRTTANT
ncbi:hypothetical protein [Marininema halotolerans]|uniref:Uncharacterized protein n=1 Tax=Marininema halotolerans TaxID=1155944 RepID=A0A1I6R7L4_9BACL|nr:hypothetical protein [Marininema halotolerans]SFS60528.1 hypothetical protein SAMN05444972_104207 [Marininema halotolerans]